MRRWLLLIAAALGVGLPTARAQKRPGDVTTPGYMIIRVALDGVAGDPAGGPPGSGPGGGGAVGGPPPGSGEMPPGGGGGGPGPGGAVTGGPERGGGGGGGRDMTKSIYVVAPYKAIKTLPFYKNRAVNPATNPMHVAAITKFGTTFLYTDSSSIQITPLMAAGGTQYQMSLEAQLHERYRVWSLDRSKNTFNIYDLTVDALEMGAMEDAVKYANEMNGLPDLYKDKSPPQKVQEFIKAWRAVAPKLDQPATQPNDAEEWRSRLSAAAVKTGTHYSIIYWGERQINPAELDRRMAALDRNFKGFYLWHALQGITLTVPDRPLMVLLADRSTDVAPFRDKLDGLPLNADAFYSPSNDLLVLSPERMDHLGAAFSDMARASYKNGWSRDELLKGTPGSAGGQKQDPIELARMMTLALVDKLMEEEMDNAAVSREGSRQLYVASGLLPRNVHLPRWLESGLGSFLQHPKGPLYMHNDKGDTTMVAGIGYGYGSPNYILHRQYREMDAKKELNQKPEVLLKNVLTDAYFAAVKDGSEIDPPPPRSAGLPNGPGAGPGPMGPPGGGPGPGGPAGRGGPPMGGGGGPGAGGAVGGEGAGTGGGDASAGSVVMENEFLNRRVNREKLQTKADATAWSLVHYLSRDRMLGVQRFYAELRRMPRDMRLDENFILLTFCKCFNLMDRLKPNEIDQAAFKNFAEQWVRSMKIVAPYGVDVAMAGQQGGQGGPAGGMGPGGMGPGGGPMRGGRGGPGGGGPGGGGPGGGRGPGGN